jgi:integrase
MRRRVDVAEILVEVRGRVTVGPPKTRAGRRSVPIPRVVAEALETRLAGLEPNEFVFRAPLGGPVRASLFHQRVWLPAVSAANLQGLRIHDLRHSAVAFWIAAGASPKEIARRAGHTSISVVLDRYAHLLPGTEEKVTDALDEMAAGAATNWPK